MSDKVDHEASPMVSRLEKLAVVSEKSINSSEKCVSSNFLKDASMLADA